MPGGFNPESQFFEFAPVTDPSDFDQTIIATFNDLRDKLSELDIALQRLHDSLAGLCDSLACSYSSDGQSKDRMLRSDIKAPKFSGGHIAMGRLPGETTHKTYKQLILAQGRSVGLSDDEIGALTNLCAKLGGYSSYEELKAVSANLAASYPTVHLKRIGHSSDYPNSRPIDLTVTGDPDGNGKKAFVKGPGHACEPGGAQSTSVLEQLFSIHPGLMRRLGYACVLSCSRIDPDGMHMQAWPINRRASLCQYVDGAWRGSWRDQVTWGYPTDNYNRVTPEVGALLSVLGDYDPDFVGSMHASQFASYAVAAQPDEHMVQVLSEILDASGLPINPDEPENSISPILAPGVFEVETAEVYKEARGSHSSGQTTADVNDGGTNIANHLPGTARLLVPEIPMHVAITPPDNPSTGKTYLDMVKYRSAVAQTVIGGIGKGLEMLGDWPVDHQGTPEIRRLYSAARWWHNTVPHMLEFDAEAAQKSPRATSVLNQAEFAMRIGLPICNSLVYAGNVRRLAEAAKRQDVVRHMIGVRDRGLKALGPTKQVDVRLQVATQVLAVIAAMEYSAS